MTNAEFYRTRADEALLAAGATSLANVRARHLRAAAAWEEMAQRAARTARHREEEATRKAMREDAAALILSAANYARRGH